ncbi:TlpA family protein disulfide reductase [Leekyejoonella antrihumi]|uniref:TlpA family protein disulfide reductase n=1 Tax=Leekyejoonella antrihumi TaxID=1660198 RepID=A0A563DWM9_9MICO|nr:TlpA disulfide reductase family protein [Leekyejoonella antrihumi]TWP34698.1 TlpA family protein disulfide reductase [Leekyejoonella antrihumi]
MRVTPQSLRRKLLRGVLVPVLALGVIGGAAGCSSSANSIAAQANQGNDKGYQAGDGTVEQLSRSERKKPVSFAGETLAGKPWSTNDVKGKVLVLNVWGAWCPPCQAEMPELEKAWKQFQKGGQPVAMMGLDQQDSPARAAATIAKWKVTYPSLRDDGGQMLLDLQNKVVTTPTTLVLDQQHRIAARVSGQVTASTLTGLVQDVLKEKS